MSLIRHLVSDHRRVMVNGMSEGDCGSDCEGVTDNDYEDVRVTVRM